MTTTFKTRNTVSESQMTYLRSLMAEREADFPEFVANVRSSLNAAWREGTLSWQLASTNIDMLKARRPQEPRSPHYNNADEQGVYVYEDGTIVKLQQNRGKTHTYTMRWVEFAGDRLVETDEHVHGEWEYAPELKGTLGQARKMTLDEAKAFIIRYGKCVRCGRSLKDGQSVERGIGPVCVQYFSF